MKKFSPKSFLNILEFLKLKNRANVFLKIDRKHVKNDFKNDAVDLSENEM